MKTKLSFYEWEQMFISSGDYDVLYKQSQKSGEDLSLLVFSKYAEDASIYEEQQEKQEQQEQQERGKEERKEH